MKFSSSAITALVCVILTACGGGGAGGTAGTAQPTITPPATTPVAVEPSTLVSTLPAQPVMSSLVGAEEIAAFNRVNEHRAACGFGYLNFDPLLTKAFENHVRYVAANEVFEHYEVAGKNYFTGVDPSNRVQAVGYDGNASEVMYFRSGLDKTGAGVQGIRTLMAGPYHMTGLLGGFRDIGFAVRSMGPRGGATADLESIQATITVVGANPALRKGTVSQLQASNEVLTYPCQGIADVAYNLISEYPNPTNYLNTGARNLEVNPIGQPIYVRLRDGYKLVITSATVTAPDSMGEVRNIELLPVLNADSDTNKGFWSVNEAVILPAKSLAKNTVHTVTIKGTNNGVEFTKSFQFTTGSASNN